MAVPRFLYGLWLSLRDDGIASISTSDRDGEDHRRWLRLRLWLESARAGPTTAIRGAAFHLLLLLVAQCAAEEVAAPPLLRPGVDVGEVL
eukprot:gene621-biopygen520